MVVTDIKRDKRYNKISPNGLQASNSVKAVTTRGGMKYPKLPVNRRQESGEALLSVPVQRASHSPVSVAYKETVLYL